MNHIRQKHNAGCGLACIAMVSGLTYKQVLKYVFPRRWFFQSPQPFPLGPVLWNLNLDYHEHLSNRIWIQQITHPAILLVRWREEDRMMFPFHSYETHAVVWDPENQSILDPARKYASPLNFYQQRACGYYEILGTR